MPTEHPPNRHRETRLLVLVVVLSIAVLLVLARYRFPSADLAVAPAPPSPLAGLAGRVAFEGLAQTMTSVLGRIAARVLVVEFAASEAAALPGEQPPPATLFGRPDTPVPAVSDVRGPASPAGLGIALRVRPDLVLLHVPPGLDPVALPGSSTPIEVVAADPQRELALVRVAPVIDIREEPGVDMFTGLDYVGVVEAMQAGPTIQPHFVGRVGRLVDERWPASVYVIDERM
jgi:hypothetical protein